MCSVLILWSLFYFLLSWFVLVKERSRGPRCNLAAVPSVHACVSDLTITWYRRQLRPRGPGGPVRAPWRTLRRCRTRRATSTTRTAKSEDNPSASPPTPPGARGG